MPPAGSVTQAAPMTALRALDSGNLGVWTRGEALTCTSRHVVARLLETGQWQVVFSGVYADGGYVLAPEQRAVAAVLASGGHGQPFAVGTPRPDGSQAMLLRAVACGRTAARVWQFPLVDDDDPATGATERVLHDVHSRAGLGVRRGPASTPGLPRDELRRHRLQLDRADFIRRPSGLWITTPLRTAWDCAGMLTAEATVCLLDDGLRRGLFTVDDLHRTLAERHGIPGSRRFDEAVARSDGRSESAAETLARLLLLPVLPALVPQVSLRAPGRTGRGPLRPGRRARQARRRHGWQAWPRRRGDGREGPAARPRHRALWLADRAWNVVRGALSPAGVRVAGGGPARLVVQAGSVIVACSCWIRPRSARRSAARPSTRSGLELFAAQVDVLEQADGDQVGEHRGAAVADERQRQPGDRHDAQGHPDVDEALERKP